MVLPFNITYRCYIFTLDLCFGVLPDEPYLLLFPRHTVIASSVFISLYPSDISQPSSFAICEGVSEGQSISVVQIPSHIVTTMPLHPHPTASKTIILLPVDYRGGRTPIWREGKSTPVHSSTERGMRSRFCVAARKCPITLVITMTNALLSSFELSLRCYTAGEKLMHHPKHLHIWQAKVLNFIRTLTVQPPLEKAPKN